MIFLVHGITSKLINLYPVGRFQKFVKFDQSKGVGGPVWPRRSRFGYWFGRPRRRGGEIDDNGV